MNTYSKIQAPIYSFFAPDFYREVAQNWRGIGALYLLVIFLIVWTVGVIGVTIPFVNQVSTASTKFFEQVPNMTFTNGKLSIDKPSPFSLKDPVGDTVIAIIDTSTNKTKLNEKDPPVFATAEKLLQQDPNGNTVEVADFKNIPDGTTMDGAQFQSWFVMLLWGFSALVWLIFCPILYMCLLIQAVLYGGISMLIAAITKKELSFPAAMRMSMIAMTPALILSMPIYVVAIIANAPLVPYAWPLFTIVMAVVYLTMGIQKLPNAEAAA